MLENGVEMYCGTLWNNVERCGTRGIATSQFEQLDQSPRIGSGVDEGARLLLDGRKPSLPEAG